MSKILYATIDELLDVHQPNFGPFTSPEKVCRGVLLKCAAELTEKKKVSGVRFSHMIYPRAHGRDTNGKPYGTEVLVINTSLPEFQNFPKKLIAVGKGDIRVNGCVSLSTDGIAFFKENFKHLL